MTAWDREKVNLLIKRYKKHEFLWNHVCESYKSKENRNRGLEEFCKNLRCLNCDPLNYNIILVPDSSNCTNNFNVEDLTQYQYDGDITEQVVTDDYQCDQKYQPPQQVNSNQELYSNSSSSFKKSFKRACKKSRKQYFKKSFRKPKKPSLRSLAQTEAINSSDDKSIEEYNSNNVNVVPKHKIIKMTSSSSYRSSPQTQVINNSDDKSIEEFNSNNVNVVPKHKIIKMTSSSSYRSSPQTEVINNRDDKSIKEFNSNNINVVPKHNIIKITSSSSSSYRSSPQTEVMNNSDDKSIKEFNYNNVTVLPRHKIIKMTSSSSSSSRSSPQTEAINNSDDSWINEFNSINVTDVPRHKNMKMTSYSHPKTAIISVAALNPSIISTSGLRDEWAAFGELVANEFRNLYLKVSRIHLKRKIMHAMVEVGAEDHLSSSNCVNN